ncbi:hypothetical protein [Pseudoplusia includens SNPV IE]|uniref:Uncharacterized protein n=1 Tax=Pseudoplusia includens SNPV IE TaxID=1592335 RepID=A0A0B5A152_9ABAC|nr:hypothetical protein [Pseudoplusia includens SNPV IE]AJD80715.1 hypothetical protein [Pseudoplusia includens SNPV IE]
MEYLKNHTILNLVGEYLNSFEDFLNLQKAMRLKPFMFWNLLYPRTMKLDFYERFHAMCYFDLLTKPRNYTKYKKCQDRFDLITTDDEEYVTHLYLPMLKTFNQYKYRKLVPVLDDKQALFDTMYEIFCNTIDMKDMFSDVPRTNTISPEKGTTCLYPKNLCEILTSKPEYVLFKGTDLEFKVDLKKYPVVLEYIQKMLTFELTVNEKCCFVKSLLGNKSNQLCLWHNVFQYYNKSEVLYKAFVKHNVFYKFVFGIEKDIHIQQTIANPGDLFNLRKILNLRDLKNYNLSPKRDQLIIFHFCIQWICIQRCAIKFYILTTFIRRNNEKKLTNRSNLKNLTSYNSKILYDRRIKKFCLKQYVWCMNKNVTMEFIDFKITTKIDTLINEHYNFKFSRKRRCSVDSTIVYSNFMKNFRFYNYFFFVN